MQRESPAAEVRVIPVHGLPEVRAGADLAALIADALREHGWALEQGDVVVVTQKVVSKAEGRVVSVENVTPSDMATRWAKAWDRDPRHIEVVLRESVRIIRMMNGIIISETRHGFKCANAGVDASNVPVDGTLALLPEDPDASAERIRAGLKRRSGVEVAVVVSDTWGRPWREGAVNVAIGVAGLQALADYRGGVDAYDHPLRTTTIAVADELAGAAELVMGKTRGVPVAVIRGYRYDPGDEGARPLMRQGQFDLFP